MKLQKKIWKTYNIYDDIVCFFELILIGRFFIGLIISGNVRGILMILIFLTQGKFKVAILGDWVFNRNRICSDRIRVVKL